MSPAPCPRHSRRASRCQAARARQQRGSGIADPSASAAATAAATAAAPSSTAAIVAPMPMRRSRRRARRVTRVPRGARHAAHPAYTSCERLVRTRMGYESLNGRARVRDRALTGCVSCRVGRRPLRGRARRRWRTGRGPAERWDGRGDGVRRRAAVRRNAQESTGEKKNYELTATS